MVARVRLKGPRAGDSGEGERILSIGRVAQKGFLEEMEFELGLDKLGIGHEVEKEVGGENGTSGWTGNICGKWQPCRNLELGSVTGDSEMWREDSL